MDSQGEERIQVRPRGDPTLVRRFPLGILFLLLLSGCGIIGPEVCTDELSWRVTPTQATLMVGESTTVAAAGLTCGGKKSVEVDMRWSSDNPAIATVHETSGRITAITPGTTEIRGHDVGPYRIPPVAISVTVTP